VNNIDLLSLLALSLRTSGVVMWLLAEFMTALAHPVLKAAHDSATSPPDSTINRGIHV
jgi:hypothetical protein